jgi:hypothetical protein
VNLPRRTIYRVVTAVFVLASVLTNAGLANAAVLNASSLSMSDPRPSQTAVDYTFQASNVTSAGIKCIKQVYSTAIGGSTAPASFSSTGASVDAASTYINGSATGWSLDASTNGTILYTHATTSVTPASGTRNFILHGVTNGNTVGTTYYLTFSTYDNVDCSTSPIDNIQLAFVFTNAQTVTVTIDPTLTFAVAGVASGQTVNGTSTNVTTTSTTVPLGTPTLVTNQVAAQDLTVSTNAGAGYTVAIRYTGAPATSSYSLADHAGTNAAPSVFTAAGTESFGYTTENTTLGTGTAGRFGSNKWAAFTTSNNEVIYSSAPVNAQTTRVGYQVGISNVTKAGNYVTTVIYTCTPVF